MDRKQTIAVVSISVATIIAAIVFVIVAIIRKKNMQKNTANIDFDFIKKWETGRTTPTLTVFRNSIDGNLEVGFGHVLPKLSTWKVGDKITPEQAEQFFMQDIEKAYNVYGSRLKWEKFTANQKLAIISHAYNTGARSETIIKKANAGDWKNLATWWQNHYVTSGGKFVQGLKNRRIAESELLTK
ncbi:MAG: lysozyme [Bacteroidales bacterium]|nr:lysozyme [Bacteroidales bacterium]MCQ2605422.1 lysozyme [Bacteroidales bacterium]